MFILSQSHLIEQPTSSIRSLKLFCLTDLLLELRTRSGEVSEYLLVRLRWDACSTFCIMMHKSNLLFHYLCIAVALPRICFCRWLVHNCIRRRFNIEFHFISRSSWYDFHVHVFLSMEVILSHCCYPGEIDSCHFKSSNNRSFELFRSFTSPERGVIWERSTWCLPPESFEDF